MRRESEFFRPPVFRVPEIHLTVELSPPAIVSAAQQLKSTVHELVMLVLSLFFRVRIISALVPCHAAAVRRGKRSRRLMPRLHAHQSRRLSLVPTLRRSAAAWPHRRRDEHAVASPALCHR